MVATPRKLVLRGIGGPDEEMDIRFYNDSVAFYAEDFFEGASVTLPHNEVRQLHDALGKYIKDHFDKID